MRNKEQKYTLIMFGQHPWSNLIKKGFNSRNGQMVKHLDRNESINKIIYVNPYFYSVRKLSLLKNLLINLSISFFSPFVSVKKAKNYSKIVVVNPLNLKRFPVLKKSFVSFLKKFLDKEVNCREGNTILWMYNPAECEILDLFPKAIKVFDTVDNWVEMDLGRQTNPWYCKSEMAVGYEKICSQKNIIIISNGKTMSEYYAKLRGDKINILEVSNGVDAIFFSPKKFERASIPKELMNCKHPIIGYVGVIQERFDLELFQYLLKNNPDYTFVIIGHISPFRKFEFNVNAPNLLYLGPKRYSEIPHYIYSFDVCIIPHQVDNMTAYMNPMKIYEYLAMGKPVVTTPLGGIDDVMQYCNIAEDYNSFNNMLKKSVGLVNCHISDKILEDYSWEQKIHFILNSIFTKC